MVKSWLKGRLGNVMFEIATGYAYALDHDMPFTISDTTKDPEMQPLYFQHLVNKNWNESTPGKWVREMQHNYQPLLWRDEWRGFNIQLMGFWQSFRYFEHRRNEVIKLFNLKHYDNWQYVGIHVRRGDYLTIPGKHILNTEGNYMIDAIYKFLQLGYTKFLVFSDDIDWCVQYFKSFIGQYEFVRGNDPLTDMAMLSSCRHFINSSSTFSAFAAWMGRAEDKIVITPREWFQSSQPEDTSDIIPPEWIKI